MIDTLASPNIVAATSDNFQSLVLENSQAGPVLANFWSRKAGPCLRQYPILDQLVHHYAGRLLLVNIDTENEFIYTKEYGIASLPTLKLFRYGQVVETWHGYQSAEELSRVLDLYVARESDQVLAKAIQQYAEGQQAEAYELISSAIINDPVNPRLPVALCKLLKHEERYADALKLIDSLPADLRKFGEIVQLNALLSFLQERHLASALSTLTAQVESFPNDLQARQQLAAHLVIEQSYEQALQQLVSIIEVDPGYQENYAQKAMLRVFDLLGREHPLVSQFRTHLLRYTH